jgi:negative regulator of genetic competence, sporulation and motility
MGYAKVLPTNLRIQSALYELDDMYYLYLQKGGASYERYSRACIQAMEFGRLYGAEDAQILPILEHGSCLIAEKALKRLSCI